MMKIAASIKNVVAHLSLKAIIAISSLSSLFALCLTVPIYMWLRNVKEVYEDIVVGEISLLDESKAADYALFVVLFASFIVFFAGISVFIQTAHIKRRLRKASAYLNQYIDRFNLHLPGTLSFIILCLAIMVAVGIKSSKIHSSAQKILLGGSLLVFFYFIAIMRNVKRLTTTSSEFISDIILINVFAYFSL
jgi:hypothetical protein